MVQKRHILTIVLCCLSGFYIVYQYGLPQNILNLYGISTISTILFLMRFFFPDESKKFTERARRHLGIKRKIYRTVLHTFNQDKKKYVLENLKGQVFNMCNENLDRIEQGKIGHIKKLNWSVKHPSVERFKGSLFELVKKRNKFALKSFVIIGEAGIGKTSAVYHFMLDCLNANAELTPIFFSLSSWKKKMTMKEWLLYELKKVYHVDRVPAGSFLREHKIFPILDGLDRLHHSVLRKRLEEIYEFAENNPLGIITRPEAFIKGLTDLKERGVLFDALFQTYELRPLPPFKVKSIISGLKTKDTLNQLIQNSPRLRHMIRYPMALQLLSIIASEANQNELMSVKDGNSTQILNQLWKQYVAYVFNQPTPKFKQKYRYHKNTILHWLKRISLHSDSFFIEELQPSFLGSGSKKTAYFFICTLITSLIISSVAGLFLAGPLDLWDGAVLTSFVVVGVLWFKNKILKFRESGEISQKVQETTHYLQALKNILLFFIPLALVLGTYFGLSTPRTTVFSGEMKFSGLFSTSEAVAGIITAILMALFYGNKTIWKRSGLEIKMVERMAYNWKRFFEYGILGGILLGTFLVPMLFIYIQFTGESTFSTWLNKRLYIENLYLMAFSAGSTLGFFLIGLMGYLSENDTILGRDFKRKKWSKPNLGVRKSFTNALRSGIVSTVLMCMIVGGLISYFEGEITSTIKAIKTGLAFGVLAFSWFGGLDAISHFVLRLLIWLENLGPFNYIRFLGSAAELRFLKPVGSGFEFLHPSLQDYFKTAEFERPITKKPSAVPIALALLCVCFVLIAGKLNSRFNNETYWQDPYGFNIVSNTPFVQRVPHTKNKLVVSGLNGQVNPILKITASGVIKVGTFMGYVPPGGTEAGFMGMSTGDLYDLEGFEEANHASLLVKNKTKKAWMAFPEEDIYGIGEKERQLLLPVQNGDTLAFLINDMEWENNSLEFKIMIDQAKNQDIKTKMIGHRGAAGIAPENSLSAIKKAIEHNADIIEVDVQQTKDGVLVLMHDKKVNRMTNATGNINTFSHDQLQHVFLKNTVKEPIPCLEDALNLIKESGSKLLIEVKHPDSHPKILQRLGELILQKNMVDKVEIFSFNKKFIEKFKSFYPDFKVGVFVLGPLDMGNLPQNINAVGVYHHSLLWFESIQEKLKEKGLEVYTWNVNAPRSMQRLLEKEVDAIITDRPDVLRQIMGRP